MMIASPPYPPDYHVECPACTSVRYGCQKCGKSISGPPFKLPPPFGSLDARHDTIVCGGCYGELVAYVFLWLNRPAPDPGKWSRS